MITRWPIRVRLTAAFTLMMALVLTGVAIGTLLSFTATFDESLDHTLTTRLHQLQLAPATSGDPGPVTAQLSTDPVVQVLDAHTGAVLSSSAALGSQPLLSPAEIAAALAGELRQDRDSVAGLPGPVRIVAAPRRRDTAVAVVAASLAGRDDAVADLARELALALPLVLVAAAGGAYLLTGAALRPVERMRLRAAAITPTDSDPRLPVPPTGDEIARLGNTLNDLLARLHATLARERQFTADASHELRTPLSLLTTELELALQRPRTPDELLAALRSALEETNRLSHLAHDLLLADTDQPQPSDQPTQARRAIPLRPTLESTLARYCPHLDEQDIVLDCPDKLVGYVNADDLTRAVTNLLDNALRHGRAPVTVTARSSDATDADHRVHIQIRDHGPGIDPQFLPHALDRFTRADPARTGGGAGLGLAITAALAHRHHGTLTATNHPDGGALLTLSLPAPPPSPPDRAAPHGPHGFVA
jgi:signal transduction histidine kinase